MTNSKRRAKQREQLRKRRMAAAKDNSMQNGSPSDIVIPVMGPTGAGKSTFINAVLGQEGRMPVGHKLSSCTAQLDYAVVDPEFIHYPKSLEGCRVVMVDTPGFDDTYEGDAEILKRIANWLEKSYHDHAVVLAGVIYLHDISHDRFSGTARRNLEIFTHLCGDAALDKVILGTTKWDRLVGVGVDGVKREAELKAEHWEFMIKSGTRVKRSQNTSESTRTFIEDILSRHAGDDVVKTETDAEKGVTLEIQEELALDRKIIPETKAGKELRYTLQEVLEMQKQMARLEADIAKGGDSDAKAKLEETKKKMHGIVEGLKELKIPFSRRFLTLFGIKLTWSLAAASVSKTHSFESPIPHKTV